MTDAQELFQNANVRQVIYWPVYIIYNKIQMLYKKTEG